MMETGMAIFVAGLLTYFMRIAPIFLPKQLLQEEAPFTKFLEYASFAIMGGIVSLHVQKAHIAKESGLVGLQAGLLPALIALAAVFGITLYKKNMVLSLLMGLVIYGGMSWFGL